MRREIKDRRLALAHLGRTNPPSRRSIVNIRCHETNRMKFFTEGLPRLGVINLQLDLQSASNRSSTLSTTSGNATATLHHQDEQEADIVLPSPASVTQTFTFSSGQSIVTARIPCLPTTVAEDLLPLVSADDIQARWNMKARIRCSGCLREVVGNREMRWKDLPSDSWVEYSDYWLCHPHTSTTDSHSHGHGHTHNHSHDHSHALQLPTIKAILGIGLIGLTSLLMHPQDIFQFQLKVSPLPRYDRPSPPPWLLDSKKVSSCNTLEDADTSVLNQFPFLLIPVDSSRDKYKRDLRYIHREYKALRIREYDEITSLQRELSKLRGGMLLFMVLRVVVLIVG